jgi:hypothetical protein
MLINTYLKNINFLTNHSQLGKPWKNILKKLYTNFIKFFLKKLLNNIVFLF